MRHTIVKLGGSVLTGPGDADAIRGILSEYEGPIVVVVSALKGVTDELALAAKRPARRDDELLARLRARHFEMAEALGSPSSQGCASAGPSAGRRLRVRGSPAAIAAAEARIDEIIDMLGELLACPASRRDRYARILSSGERLSAACVAVAAAAEGRPGPILEPSRLGLVARGSDRDAEADIPASAPSIRKAVDSLDLAIVPGFYGVAEDGRPLLFGRGGSDYSAAVIAACLGARSCDLVKDVPGIFSSDPGRDPDARALSEISYGEAAAMAAGGSKVLHPRCVAPLAAARVVLRVRGSVLSDGMTLVRERPAPGARAQAAPGGGLAAAAGIA
jgi:bifunctional aspartokinase / homoserine dehydrogenase 1